jgi:hypothetical protein
VITWSLRQVLAEFYITLASARWRIVSSMYQTGWVFSLFFHEYWNSNTGNLICIVSITNHQYSDNFVARLPGFFVREWSCEGSRFVARMAEREGRKNLCSAHPQGRIGQSFQWVKLSKSWTQLLLNDVIQSSFDLFVTLIQTYLVLIPGFSPYIALFSAAVLRKPRD